MKQSVIAIITARGGSKRIPKKNIKEFCGKPIIAYSIEAALESKLFDEVMVSTDSEEIAEVAKRYGAVVPFYRSEKTSDDFATTSDVLLEVIREYEKRGSFFDKLCCIYPTAPFITGEKLIEAGNLLESGKADSVIPVTKFSYPPQRGMIIENEKLALVSPEYIDARSQDLPCMYHDVGQFYFVEVEALKKNRKLMAGNCMPYIVSELEVQDIDNITDWRIAELKFQIMKENNGCN